MSDDDVAASSLTDSHFMHWMSLLQHIRVFAFKLQLGRQLGMVIIRGRATSKLQRRTVKQQVMEWQWMEVCHLRAA